MSTIPPVDPNRRTRAAWRKLVTPAEAATILGMVTVIFSLFLTWERRSFSVAGALPIPAVYGSATAEVLLAGNGTTARWPMMICAFVSCGMLIWPVNARSRFSIAVVQGASSLACLIIPLTRLTLLPGVVLGLIGGGLLVAGAIDRVRAIEQTGARL